MSQAYLVLVTWPDGTEGLLFPRPGNVPINTTVEQGMQDYAIAVDHLNEWLESNPSFKEKTKVRLVRFTRHEAIKEYPEPPPEQPIKLNLPPKPWPEDMNACPKCGRQMSHTQKWGYVCEYCAGIED